MRRLLSIFILLLLPLQFAFAAAAPYCALEKAKIGSHFGHHEHPDAPAKQPINDDVDPAELQDCSVCHLVTGQALPATGSTYSPPPAGMVHASADDRRAQHHQEPTERPPRPPLP